MRITLTGVVLLLLTVAPIARGQSDGETVSLLVPVDAETGMLRAQSAHDARVGWKRVVVPVSGSVQETVNALADDLGTEVLIERSYPLLGGEDEPLFNQQWALENTGQGGTADADIDASAAWSVATGNGVIVAVIDSGVEMTHPDLDDQIWTNSGEEVNGLDDDGNDLIDDVVGWDFYDGDNDPSPVGSDDDDAHATFIAGIIAAEWNGAGMAGLAPGARIMNLRACDLGECPTLDATVSIYYAVDSGADIINLSFGGPVPEGEGDPPLESAIEYARQHDVLVVTAAGNTPPEFLEGFEIIPAELPHANNVAVAATDGHDDMADFSYYGPNIDIAAPGVNILSTGLTSYGTWEGTSFAAPYVAGAAALLLSDSPSASHLEISARLKAWVDSPAEVVDKVESGRLNAGSVLQHRFLDTLGHTFEGDADWAGDEGVTKGCDPPDNTLFCPDDDVTRGQMAAFLNRYLDLPATSTDHFIDDDGTTFEGDINRLAEAGITKGCNPPANDRFCADDNVSREQMAAFLVRAFGLTANTHPGFDDVDSSNTFVNDIGKLATAGITKGCNPPANTNYCPDDDVTRGQMAAFLRRADN